MTAPARATTPRSPSRALSRSQSVVRLHPRSALALTVASLVGLASFAWPLFTDPGSALDTSHSADAPWLFVLLLPLLAAVVLAELTEGGIDAKAVALLGMLAAVGAALRALGPGTVGLEPSFVVILLGGRVFGRGFGFVLGALVVFAGGLVTGGIGPWLPFQMFAAAWTGFFAGSLPGWRGRAEVWLLAVYGVVSGIAFGLLMNMWFWPFASYGPEVSFVAGDPLAENLHRYLLFWATTSLGWDVPRGLLSAVLVVLAGRPILNALRRTARRAAFDAQPEFAPVVGAGRQG
ncbi:MAG TPA: ECF transporter S component [Nocardioidaceae bacterium]|nr:ECF transporter S component [Nocardioidaceae bacterium]